MKGFSATGIGVLAGGAFVLGLGCGWMLKLEAGTAAGEGEPVARVRERSDPRLVRGPRTTANSGVLERLAEAGYDDGKWARELEDIDPQEIAGLLAELGKRAGLSGMKWEDERIFDKLLARWYELDPAGALAWAAGLENDEDRRKYLRELVEKEVEADFDKALEMVETYLRKDDGGLDMPHGMAAAAAKLGAEAVIRLSRASISTSTSRSGAGAVYPVGFDFRMALEGIVDLEAGLPEGSRVGFTPSNLLEAWSEQDPQAAFEWLQQGRKVPFNHDASDFLEGYAKVADAADLGMFAAQLYNPEASGGQPHEPGWRVLAEKPQLETLEAYLDGVPGDRGAHLQGLFHQSLSGSGGKYDQVKQLLLTGMSAEQRVAALESAAPGMLRGGEVLRKTMLKLGHPAAEVAHLIPAEEER